MLRANAGNHAGLTRRTSSIATLVAIILSLGSCSQLRAERVIAAEQAREAVAAQLQAPLVERPSITTVASLTDVTATYVMQTSTERLLLVVFATPAATDQLTGAATPSTGDLVVVRNVVAVYERERGTVDRLADVRSALARLNRAAG